VRCVDFPPCISSGLAYFLSSSESSPRAPPDLKQAVYLCDSPVISVQTVCMGSKLIGLQSIGPKLEPVITGTFWSVLWFWGDLWIVPLSQFQFCVLCGHRAINTRIVLMLLEAASSSPYLCTTRYSSWSGNLAALVSELCSM
jgi:hypothetical protein